MEVAKYIYEKASFFSKNRAGETTFTYTYSTSLSYITVVALVGGGANPHPGEISLAHNGVLFLDELAEFRAPVLDVMRQPLEDRKITVARAKGSVEYPASFTLVAAMNPCPCGHYGDPTHTCTCTPAAIHRYLARISGPFLDRIDLQVPIQAVAFSELQKAEPGEPSAPIRARVIAAREIQTARFAQDKGVYCNAQMNSRQIRKYCKLDEASEKMLEMAMTRLGLSARAYDRILKVSRTIADLEGSSDITSRHLQEAISYRELDKEEQWL